ncbi:MAG: ABC transporter permease subunit [Alphaproteobacteria bacterium]
MPSFLSRYWPALVVLTFVGTILCVALTGLLTYGQFDPQILTSKRTWYVIKFSLWEASLSTVLSLLFGTGLALAFHRRKLIFRSFFLNFLSVSFVLPPIVVVAGIIGVFGRNGWLSNLSDSLIGVGFSQWLYGLPGILIAHVFFNAAFSARVLLGQLETTPGGQWRTARQLGFTSKAVWRLIDWPVLKPALPSLAVLIFLLTFTSFSIVLTLGGGPKASTLEVAIFEALSFDFDIGKAVTLASIQVLIGLIFLTIKSATNFPWPKSISTTHSVMRADTKAFGPKILDTVTLLVAFFILVLPSLALVLQGFGQIVVGKGLDLLLLEAILNSLLVATIAAALSISLAIFVAITHANMPPKPSLKIRILTSVTSQAATIILVLPIFVLSTGLFIVLRKYWVPSTLTLPLLIIINALMTLPFATAQLTPAFIASNNQNARNCRALGLKGFTKFFRVDLPFAKPALARATAFCIALSLGDLGIVALFGSENFKTLPLLLYQRMGSYRFGEAMATALVLVVLVICLFLLCEHFGKHKRKKLHVKP